MSGLNCVAVEIEAGDLVLRLTEGYVGTGVVGIELHSVTSFSRNWILTASPALGGSPTRFPIPFYSTDRSYEVQLSDITGDQLVMKL